MRFCRHRRRWRGLDRRRVDGGRLHLEAPGGRSRRSRECGIRGPGNQLSVGANDPSGPFRHARTGDGAAANAHQKRADDDGSQPAKTACARGMSLSQPEQQPLLSSKRDLELVHALEQLDGARPDPIGIGRFIRRVPQKSLQGGKESSPRVAISASRPSSIRGPGRRLRLCAGHVSRAPGTPSAPRAAVSRPC